MRGGHNPFGEHTDNRLLAGAAEGLVSKTHNYTGILQRLFPLIRLKRMVL